MRYDLVLLLLLGCGNRSMTAMATGSPTKIGAEAVPRSPRAAAPGAPELYGVPVRRVAFSPDGRRLAGGDEHGQVRFWPRVAP